MLRIVDEKTGKTVITEKDNGEVEFHVEEDKKKDKKQEDDE